MKITLSMQNGITAHALARMCRGILQNEENSDFKIYSLCTDSREAESGALFIALKGERVDGHDYIVNALNAGCRCILCEYVPTNISGRMAAYGVVENSIDADLVRARDYLNVKIALRKALTNYLNKKLKRKPMIIPIIIETK